MNIYWASSLASATDSKRYKRFLMKILKGILKPIHTEYLDIYKLGAFIIGKCNECDASFLGFKRIDEHLIKKHGSCLCIKCYKIFKTKTVCSSFRRNGYFRCTDNKCNCNITKANKDSANSDLSKIFKHI
jgi:hypothetical protein